MRMIDPLYISMCHSVFISYVTYIISQSTLDDGAAFPLVEAASDDEDD